MYEILDMKMNNESNGTRIQTSEQWIKEIYAMAKRAHKNGWNCDESSGDRVKRVLGFSLADLRACENGEERRNEVPLHRELLRRRFWRFLRSAMAS